ncbi:efflux RND transporter permease subunit [Parendozoicomonas sp. Alg238-R29]|uniref:efflux RND transporter permease subunit n=1 Tax=Parendozoicomonas sp. Alg238-R29 TaxID=2993446 RepID=UPI00248DEF8F|nr:efflux RND transporter permease subunit [Parendozoicomonas sp. Alg238-R29]
MKASAEHSLIGLFTSHRVAANLVMFLMILAGLWGIQKLNTQFFPEFEIDVITVSTVWSGATADDIQRAITIPVERELKGIAGIDRYFSSSSPGSSRIRLEINRNADVAKITDKVRQTLAAMTTLPSDAEKPLVDRFERFESIARVVIAGGNSLNELRPLARRLEQDILNRGVRKATFTGLPELEMAIELDSVELHRLGLTLPQIAAAIQKRSVDFPAGTAGIGTVERPLRSLGQARLPSEFANLPLLTQTDGQVVRLGDVASVALEGAEGQPVLTVKGKPAVELTLYRTRADDTLEAAAIMQAWVKDIRKELPADMDVVVYDQSWSYLDERLQLLLKNGAGGLILVIAILFLFLNVNVAFWVTVGIPISFLASLAVLELIGGSINIISLFGLIMVLGIIVDDAIVVGENILAHVQDGESPRSAAIDGARRMIAPVTAASLTTIAAFLPLLILQGNVGNMLVDIPTVVICVIIASLVECFLILPGHLYHSLGSKPYQPSKRRQKLDAAFDRFREQSFRPLVRAAVQNRGTTMLVAVCLFVISLSLLMTGHLRFTFFPTIDGQTMRAAFQFTPGTPASEVDAFMEELERSLRAAEKNTGETLVVNIFQLKGEARFSLFSSGKTTGDGFGTLIVDLVSTQARDTKNAELIRLWKQELQRSPGLERFTIAQAKAGPPGKSIELKLIGSDIDNLKTASLELQEALGQYPGTSNIEDDLPWGREQLIFELNATGKALGLSLQDVGQRLRTAIDGQRLQIYHQRYEEVEVHLRLPRAQREHLETIYDFPLVMEPDSTERLDNLVDFSSRRGLDTLKRVDGQLAVQVSADVDETVINSNQILAELEAELLPELMARYGLRYGYEGQSAEQSEMMEEMKLGLVIALALIYIILTWVFSSWSWPLAVMIAIPFGITGALFGHWFTGLDLTVMSQFGLFGLTGIVVNDSIVLLTFYRELREKGLEMTDAIIEAACQRLRAVLLTSLTTVGGLLPILFETSPQAQFLIPMATTIVFGLLFGTGLILLVVPSLLVALEDIKLRGRHMLAPAGG